MVLLCSKRGLGDVIGEATYKVKAKFNLNEMQVIEGDTIDDPTFFIRDDTRNIQLFTEYVYKNNGLNATVFHRIEICDVYVTELHLKSH